MPVLPLPRRRQQKRLGQQVRWKKRLLARLPSAVAVPGEQQLVLRLERQLALVMPLALVSTEV
jgi:hypothetical protein